MTEYLHPSEIRTGDKLADERGELLWEALEDAEVETSFTGLVTVTLLVEHADGGTSYRAWEYDPEDTDPAEVPTFRADPLPTVESRRLELVRPDVRFSLDDDSPRDPA